MVKDDDGNDEYLELSYFDVPLVDEKGNLTDKWIPYTDYYNVVPPKEKLYDIADALRTQYDPTKIYLNHGHSILTIPVEILNEFERPLYFHLKRKDGYLLIVFEDKIDENSFDIQEKVYNGEWKGIRVLGGELGHALCVEMGVHHYLDQLKIMPVVDKKRNVCIIPLDEIKRSAVDIKGIDFLLPQWQYDELAVEEIIDD